VELRLSIVGLRRCVSALQYLFRGSGTYRAGVEHSWGGGVEDDGVGMG